MSEKKKSNYSESFLYFIIILLVISALYFATNPKLGTKVVPQEVEISELYKNPDLEVVTVEGNTVIGTLKDGSELIANKEPQEVVGERLADRPEIKVKVKDMEKGQFWMDIMISFIPFVLIVGFLLLMMRQAQRSNSSAMSFGKSRARLYSGEKTRITFKDVAGVQEAKEDLVEIVDFLKHPKKYLAIGAKIPKGVMMFGPPGTGKTLLAKAVAGEANVPFFNISGSEFVEMFVGVGASRVRDLFNKAKRNAPCIIFIDEIDAVGRHRGAGLGGGHDEREQTLNQILVEMDGFDTGTNVIVIAATNRPDVLDPALLRPGRFDRRVIIDAPNSADRAAILKVHSQKKPLAANVDLRKIAGQTPGFSGADLENLMNEAAIITAKKGQKQITTADLESALEKVTLGPERKSRVLSEEEKKITAYHESGHALVAKLLANCDPVHKVSIVSRGMALGVTWYLPERDQHLYSKAKFEHDMAAMLGGYAAEELTFGEVTTGSSSDLKRVTELARKMVTEHGMSSKLGPVTFNGGGGHSVFLGRELGEQKNYSDETAAMIDQEVEKLVREAHLLAKQVLSKNKQSLKKIAEELIKHETLDSKSFQKLFKPSKKGILENYSKPLGNKSKVLSVSYYGVAHPSSCLFF
ncbi:MAG: ATP-dependent zinc metalloprotease FtsH [Candidatus Gracilibacteria bacterium]|nr:ATP-dependent zinc metalloprotease FtsH [Candidatus Gracilibacteria bacterium]